MTAADLRSHPDVQFRNRSLGIKAIVIDVPNWLTIDFDDESAGAIHRRSAAYNHCRSRSKWESLRLDR
ncbi:hypothetical protein [Acaryochloris sp. IP29b_bin.137]|uniref:hypothetical protein n=1 Tax=Acaryochloris sp. IP29b_bin.137 TaxID=2969217 RepID=UPI00260D9982|nr:hypothetical protein [Acaryochloris sp. IP29b_bin.137]